MRNLLLVSIFILYLTACGKKGPLYYPDMLVPAAPSATSVSQSGSSVKIQFVLPDKDRAGRKLSDLAGVKINKRISDSSQEQVCNSCMTDYRLLRELYIDQLPDGAQRYGNRILVLDGDVLAGKTYSYTVMPFTKDGVGGAPSPQVSVSFVQPTLPPTLQAESFPTEIRLSFISLPPVTGRFVGHNLYRTRHNDPGSYLPINREPLTGTDFVDSGLERNVTYHYSARTLVELNPGNVVESMPSNLVEGMLKNDE